MNKIEDQSLTYTHIQPVNAIHDEIKNSSSAPIVRDIVYIFKIVRVFMKKTWPNPILYARFDAFERENSILLRNIIFDFIFFSGIYVAHLFRYGFSQLHRNTKPNESIEMVVEISIRYP